MPGDVGLVNTSQYDSQLSPGDKIHKWGPNIGSDDTYTAAMTLVKHCTQQLSYMSSITLHQLLGHPKVLGASLMGR